MSSSSAIIWHRRSRSPSAILNTSLSGLVLIDISGIECFAWSELLYKVSSDRVAKSLKIVAAAALIGCSGLNVLILCSLQPIWCGSMKLVLLRILHLQISILLITA